MSIVDDVTPFIDEVYPLYLQVYERSKLPFEKPTKAYSCRMGHQIPDKVRFFIWRQEGKIVAFTLCMPQDESIYAEYIGLITRWRHRLDPVDLYVRHNSAVGNAILKWLLPLLEPTRYDKTLQKFPNYKELWAPP